MLLAKGTRRLNKTKIKLAREKRFNSVAEGEVGIESYFRPIRLAGGQNTAGVRRVLRTSQ